MSLINHMLSDLQERRAGVPITERTVLNGLGAVIDDPPRPYSDRAVWLVSTVLLLAGVVWWQYASHYPRATGAPPHDVMQFTETVPFEPAAVVTQGVAEPVAEAATAIPAAPIATAATDRAAFAVDTTRVREASYPDRVAAGSADSTSAGAAAILPPDEPTTIKEPEPALLLIPAATLAELAPLPGTAAAPALFEKTARDEQTRQIREEDYRAAVAMLRLGHTQRGMRNLGRLVEHDPDYVDARLLLAATLAEDRRADAAVQLLRVGLARQSTDPQLASVYAKLLLKQGQLAAALQALLRAPPPIDVDPDYHSLIAAVYQRQGEHQAAIDVYRAILKTDASNGLWWMGLAISLAAQGSATDALGAFATSLDDVSLPQKLRVYINQQIQTLTATTG